MAIGFFCPKCKLLLETNTPTGACPECEISMVRIKHPEECVFCDLEGSKAIFFNDFFEDETGKFKIIVCEKCFEELNSEIRKRFYVVDL